MAKNSPFTIIVSLNNYSKIITLTLDINNTYKASRYECKVIRRLKIQLQNSIGGFIGMPIDQYFIGNVKHTISNILQDIELFDGVKINLECKINDRY
jgi:hypothetical protein